MCGIAGLIGFDSLKTEKSEVLKRMLHQIRHRGPDASQVETGEGWGIGHVRLSIVDLEGGNQPLWSHDRRIGVVGNHEIYNAPELRLELEDKGHQFLTHCSDTEVLVYGWREWGEGLFQRLNGMFGAAILDLDQKVCVLARDAMGMKPLHWVQVGDSYAFASEIKAFFEIPSFVAKPDLDSLHLFMNLRYQPSAESSLFQGVQRLRPGTFQRFSLVKKERVRSGVFFDWNQLSPCIEKKENAQVEEELSELLKKSVHRHLPSEVELGTYLSGGLDSSVLTALASQEIPGLRSFCLGFGEPTDELKDAEKVARLLETRHTEIRLDEPGADILSRYRKILWHVEEPKINCIQGYVLAEKAREYVKAILSGMGGDELFAGYVNNDFLFPQSLIAKVWPTGKSIRSLSMIQKLWSPFQTDLIFRAGELGLNFSNPVLFYSILRNSFDHSPYLMKSLYRNPPAHWMGMTAKTLEKNFNHENPDLMNEFLKLEARTKLPNDFLLTEDRVSMAHGLEVRSPFLDLDLVKFAFSLPSSLNFAPGHKKKLLKKVARRWLPKEVIDKKKWGFSFNPYLLFQTQLKSFCQETLTRERVEELGVFSWDWIKNVLEASPSPRLRWHYFTLWTMAGVALWYDTFFLRGRSETRI